MSDATSRKRSGKQLMS